MPRLPKDPDQRQRRNKASTAADLPAPAGAPLRKVPPLTMTLLGLRRGQGPIRGAVVRWWNRAWRSPMASRWLETDIEVLVLAAQLHHQLQVFLEEGKSVASIAAEIRQQEGRIGLD